jgi:hypothetical protein
VSQIVKTAADQIAVIGTLTSGAIASVHVREAVAGGIGFLWEINGTHTVPDFADAVRRHELIAAIERSAASGVRVKA